MNRTNATFVLAATVAIGTVAGCTKHGTAPYDGLSYHEREALRANQAETDPGMLARSRELAGDLFWKLPKRVIERINHSSAGDNAAKLRSSNPASRRLALLDLASRDFGGQDDYVTVYTGYAQSDPDPTVRAAALRALNLTRTGETALFIEGLRDDEPLVRLESAKALSNMPDDAAIEPLLTITENRGEDTDIRIAAADALKNYPQIDVARRLANLVGDRNFSVAWQAGQSLRYLTGENYDYKPGQWLTYLSESDKPFG